MEGYKPSFFLDISGQVAQLVEQRTENPRVGGSIPSLAIRDDSALQYRITNHGHPSWVAFHLGNEEARRLMPGLLAQYSEVNIWKRQNWDRPNPSSRFVES